MSRGFSVMAALVGKGLGGGLPRWLSLGFALAAVSHTYGEEPSARARFLQEYEPHYKAIREYYGNVHGQYEFRGSGGSGKTIINLVEVKANPANFLLIGALKTVDAKTGAVIAEGRPNSIDGWNAQYSFGLNKKPDNQFVLRSLKPPDADVVRILSPLSVPYGDYWGRKQTYLELARNESVRCLSYEDCVWQEKPMKELKIQYTWIQPKTKKPEEGTEAYYFSPADGWICCGNQGYPIGKLKEVYSYESVAGEPFPALRRIERSLNEEKFSVIEVTEFRHVAEPFPDADFRLSAFGLPEPVGVTTRQRHPTRSWLWLLLGAGGSAAVAVLLLWLWRRRRRTVGSAQK